MMTPERIAAVRSKAFPIQATRGNPSPLSCSWQTAETAYGQYAAMNGTDQSLERLAERGGFSAGEMDDLFPGWRKRDEDLEILRTENARLTLALAESKAELRIAIGCIEGKNQVLRSYRSGTWKGPSMTALKKISKWDALAALATRLEARLASKEHRE